MYPVGISLPTGQEKVKFERKGRSSEKGGREEGNMLPVEFFPNADDLRQVAHTYVKGGVYIYCRLIMILAKL